MSRKGYASFVWNGWCCAEMVHTAERDQTLAGQVFRFLLGGHPLHLEAEVARLPSPLCN